MSGTARTASKGIWIGLLAAPFAAALLLSVGYALVPWACRAGLGAALHVPAVFALALAAFGAWKGWRAWRAESAPDRDRIDERRRFLAVAAVFLSVYFLAVILALEVPNLMLEPCAGVDEAGGGER